MLAGKQMNLIKSSDNKKIKDLKKLLTSKKHRKLTNSFLVEGLRSVKGFISYPQDRYFVDSIFVKESTLNGSGVTEIINQLKNISLYVLDDKLFSQISDVENSQGIIIKAMIKNKKTEITGNRYLLLDNLSDPGNMGTLIRTAVAAGYAGLLIYGHSVDVYNPKVVRSTMGTLPYLDIIDVNIDSLKKLKSEGYSILCADASGDQNIYDVEPEPKTIVVIGNEANGLSTEIMNIATHVVSIPVAKECESLNAAVAGSIMMFMLR